MKETVEEITDSLVGILSAQIPPLRTKDGGPKGQLFEGTIPAMQGKQKVDGHYFATIVPKPKDCRLYFFQIYTHANEFELSAELKKYLKGKSCFHIKKLSAEIEAEISEMVKKGVELYRSDQLI